MKNSRHYLGLASHLVSLSIFLIIVKLNFDLLLGVPEIRGVVWSLLSDYIPIDQEIAEDTIIRKREEYIGIVHHYFEDCTMEQTVQDLANKIEDMSSYETLNFK